jgi:hypothetical protein
MRVNNARRILLSVSSQKMIRCLSILWVRASDDLALRGGSSNNCTCYTLCRREGKTEHNSPIIPNHTNRNILWFEWSNRLPWQGNQRGLHLPWLLVKKGLLEEVQIGYTVGQGRHDTSDALLPITRQGDALVRVSESCRSYAIRSTKCCWSSDGPPNIRTNSHSRAA